MMVSNGNRIFLFGWTIHLRFYPWKTHIDFGHLSRILCVNHVIKWSVLHRTSILYLQLSYSVKPETPLELNEKLRQFTGVICHVKMRQCIWTPAGRAVLCSQRQRWFMTPDGFSSVWTLINLTFHHCWRITFISFVYIFADRNITHLLT